MTIDAAALRDEVRAQRGLAARLFERLFAGSADTVGVTRDTYGEGENFAHGLMAQTGREMGLEVETDLAANTFATLPGQERARPRILIGSHLDSVPRGGNFDGAAGVVAGLVAIAALRKAGINPSCDIAVMGVRAEESVWFQSSYIGSRAALGMLAPGVLDMKRVDTGRRLADHMRECGADPEEIRAGGRSINPAGLRAFLEIHIEQAPSLVEAGLPIAICTGVPGNFRYPAMRIEGQHGHVGTPRTFRRDAVMAATDFVQALDRLWAGYEERGIPMACTLGRFHTDAAFHGLTNVPGLFHLSLDIRAYEESQLLALEREVANIIASIESVRKVKFHKGARTSAPVAKADADLFQSLIKYADRLEIPVMPLGSPGSHDSAAFADANVPTAMILVRNRNGSHNPDEAMDIDDFLEAVAVLTLWLAEHAAVTDGG